MVCSMFFSIALRFGIKTLEKTLGKKKKLSVFSIKTLEKNVFSLLFYRSSR